MFAPALQIKDLKLGWFLFPWLEINRCLSLHRFLNHFFLFKLLTAQVREGGEQTPGEEIGPQMFSSFINGRQMKSSGDSLTEVVYGAKPRDGIVYWASQHHFVLNLGSSCTVLHGQNCHMSFQMMPIAKVSIKDFPDLYLEAVRKYPPVPPKAQRRKSKSRLLFNVNAFSEMLMDITKFTLNLVQAQKNQVFLLLK